MHQSRQTIDASNLNQNLLSALQQEVDFGAQALKRGNPDVAVTFFQSALQKMTAEMPFYDHIVHNLLLSYKSLVEKLLSNGDTAQAIRFVRAALSLEVRGPMVDDSVFLQRFAEAFQGLGLACFGNGQFDASLDCCRKAIAVYPSASSYINLTNSLSVTGQRPLLSDYTTEIATEQLGRHIFIACVPKSASTFLKNVLVNLTGFRDVFMVYAAGQTEHEIYLPTLKETAHLDTVTQQHCRASDANIHLMQAFGIRPIVLVRNIFDSVMSLLDFYNVQGAHFNSYFRADFSSLDEDTKIDLLIDNVIPWYFQFVASWSEAEKRHKLPIHWLTYEHLISNKTAAVEEVLGFYGLGAPLNAVDAKIASTEAEGRKIRFNKGVAGRGRTGLSELQKERIRRFARYHPSTDFGRIGL
ncbi:MAG TPA: sulfotransferase domain-containing protein [Pyrinomonadaceae bacterium]|nr:sulfotransferase domain-containing protein [Pyrinomonadaceae bacterium]